MLSAATTTLVEKAAFDAGFDTSGSPADGWVPFASTHAPLRIWIGGEDGAVLRVAVSMAPVAAALVAEGTADGGAADLPPGAARSLAAEGVQQVYALLRRAFALSRSLPDTPLQRFKAETSAMPRTTEAERLVVQRVGQDYFRQSLLDYWGSRCAVTGLAIPGLLRASHIKPWADCATDDERLDVFNGLLLAPHLDALFDGGWMTVERDGVLRLSNWLDTKARAALGATTAMRCERLAEHHEPYLEWHRRMVFEKWVGR